MYSQLMGTPLLYHHFEKHDTINVFSLPNSSTLFEILKAIVLILITIIETWSKLEKFKIHPRCTSKESNI